MAVKLTKRIVTPTSLFESDVILYGGQAVTKGRPHFRQFESDVILYGGQAIDLFCGKKVMFESDVILYGGQADTTYIYKCQ